MGFPFMGLMRGQGKIMGKLHFFLHAVVYSASSFFGPLRQIIKTRTEALSVNMLTCHSMLAFLSAHHLQSVGEEDTSEG